MKIIYTLIFLTLVIGFIILINKLGSVFYNNSVVFGVTVLLLFIPLFLYGSFIFDSNCTTEQILRSDRNLHLFSSILGFLGGGFIFLVGLWFFPIVTIAALLMVGVIKSSK